jgi:hypothetical protein
VQPVLGLRVLLLGHSVALTSYKVLLPNLGPIAEVRILDAQPEPRGSVGRGRPFPPHSKLDACRVGQLDSFRSPRTMEAGLLCW